jgi:glycosyltransferase involved in cell wall biosynthesis
MTPSSVCMLLHKSVVHDSRVRREASALAEAGHAVTVLELDRDAGGTLDGFARVPAEPPRWLRRALPFHLYRALFLLVFVRRIVALRPEVVHAHDAAMLLPGVIGARLTGAKLVYDSHELATGVPYREGGWARFVAAVERVAVPRADAVVTVSDGIAERLQARYRLAVRPAVVRNLCALPPGAPDGSLRAATGVGDAPLVLHQGAAAAGRGCETLVRAVAALPDAHAVFLGYGDEAVADGLRAIARTAGATGRVHFVPSVVPERLLARTAEADVGVALLEDTCENHRLALPNKLFEYAAAGVPVVASDLPEMRRTVERLGLGETVDARDPEAVAAALARALAGATERRAAAGVRWEDEKPRLLAVYDVLLGHARPPRAVVLVRNPVTHDARVEREVATLSEAGYEAVVVGVVSAAVRARRGAVGGAPLIRLDPGAALRRRRRAAPVSTAADGEPRRDAREGALAALRRTALALDFYRQGIGAIRALRPQLVHCNDWNTMWIGVAAKALTSARVVYDAHELWADRNGRREPRPWLLAAEALFVRVADEVVTTSPGYAAVLARRYRTRAPRVVRNIPAAGPAHNGAAPASAAELAYLGGVMPGRGLEQAIEALRLVPEVRLAVTGPGSEAYRAALRAHAERHGVADRVELRPPVPPNAVVGALAGARVGLCLIQPICRSYELTLPNKLLEYAAAGLPVLASDLPVIAAVTREHDLGEVVPPGDAAAIAAGIRRLLEPARNADCRRNAERFARTATWERERRILRAAYGGEAAA